MAKNRAILARTRPPDIGCDEVLRSHGVDYLQDIPAAATDVILEQDIRGIPGQTSGIALQYLWMLAGSDNFIKPDRMILRFLKAAVGREVAVSEAPDLVREATRNLQVQHPDLTPRVLDHEIWKYQRERGTPSAKLPLAGDQATAEGLSIVFR